MSLEDNSVFLFQVYYSMQNVIFAMSSKFENVSEGF